MRASKTVSVAVSPGSNAVQTPELRLTRATLAALEVKATESSSKYSYHLRPTLSQLEPTPLSPSPLHSRTQAKPLCIGHHRYSLQPRGREEFGELYRKGAVMQASAPCKSDPLQYHLDQFPVWGGLRHYSPTPRGCLLPTQDGIEAEWQDIQTTRLRRGYNRSSIVTPGRIPTRHLPLIARSPTYPREESTLSSQPKMTPRGVTFYTTGSEADSEEEKPKKNPLFWTPKSFKNLFLPSVPHPKGIGTGSYVTGLLNK